MIRICRAVDADAPAIAAFVRALSPASRRFRFFFLSSDEAIASGIDEQLHDPMGVTLVATASDGTIVGHAFYMTTGPAAGELAIEVADRFQGHGLGVALLRRLCNAAERRGITRLDAYVLADNAKMLALLHDSGLVQAERRDDDVLRVTIGTSGANEAWREMREGAAAPRSESSRSSRSSPVHPLFASRS